MASLLTAADKTTLNEAMDSLHDTFARDIQIIKEANNDGNRTILRPLTSSSRKEEIARMLSGSEITDEARAAALKLLKKHI